MELGDIWLKVARNQALTPQEEEFLRIEGHNTQMRNQFVAGNTGGDGKLIFNTPFNVIFSERFTTDTASITVPIPSGFNHLQFYCNGRCTSAGTGTVSLAAQCNGDTGANYGTQNLFAINTTVTAQRNLTNDRLTIGALTLDGSGANESVNSFATLSNYLNTSWHKSATMFCGFGGSSDSLVMTISSSWRNTSPIFSLLIYPTSGSIKTGTTISIYGVL